MDLRAGTEDAGTKKGAVTKKKKSGGGGDSWIRAIYKACDCTYLTFGGGNTISIKCARSGLHDDEQVADNVMAVVSQISSSSTLFPGKFKNVKALYLKTHDSVALPIYNASIAEGEADADALAGKDEPAAAPKAPKRGKSKKETTPLGKRKSEREAVGADDGKKKKKSEKTTAAPSSAKKEEKEKALGGGQRVTRGQKARRA